MDDFIVARAIHVLAVLMWIGGLAFVTTVVTPYVRHGRLPARRLAAFQEFERRFAPQARIWVLLAGASGFWMVHRASLWSRFADPHFWWMHAMVALWAIFIMMLFVIEPLFLHRHMEESTNPIADFDRLERMHRILLLLAVITLLGAVAGSHGLI
ncbi:hypothetical protein [Sphingobium nicotianae]|uniref:Copper resistance protein D domain-containing protein n=1 Tax=Sphingobium nicotianae TaxID=2782607 RepID=A0A9X1DCH8_9SPHN|nr:hypothetical protein [Sphingobium nicotianae]MBT2187173.1 hypothetical protein [Sphingobium nicotianae]